MTRQQMNRRPLHLRSRALRHVLTALALATASGTASAHGDEPHGDEPHPVATAAPGAPRLEAATDAFELVARLEEAGLTLFVNRFETNEPVLQAQVELESGALKAVAAYQAGPGSYVVADAAFLKALRQPGSHPLVVTVTAGDEADLLEGTLDVADDSAAAPTGAPRAVWLPAVAGTLGVAALLGAAGLLALRRRRRIRMGGVA